MARTTYIATGIPRVADQQALAASLAELGVELTFDWTRHGTLAGNPRDEVAVTEIKAVMAADFLVVLLPGGRGTHAELGAALASDKTVFLHATDESVLLGGDTYTCVFYHHPSVHQVFGSMDDLVKYIHDWMYEDSYG